ncbi:MAG TPA: PHP domain-containing protein [Phycisphaerae bacterium]|nr:PHP domain-containing protein [Phycisphaerae bacterium]HDZ43880.1 PHP domain-containing protein [Phycisphaerae bacterium]
MKTFWADLHVHTCLSPCGDDRMRPRAMVQQAKQKGLDLIAVCDHNASGNVEAVRQAGRGEGLAVIGGIEVTSEEEVHVLALFDEQQGLRDMQRLIDESLSGENNPDLFGEQLLCDERDAIVGQDTRLLIGATALRVEIVVDSIHHLGGLAIASHVDRESFSILSQLGFVPENLAIDAVEVSPRRSVAQVYAQRPELKAYPAVRSSDAHTLEQIGAVRTGFTAAAPSVRELHRALLGEGGRAVMN